MDSTWRETEVMEMIKKVSMEERKVKAKETANQLKGHMVTQAKMKSLVLRFVTFIGGNRKMN